MMNDKTKNIVVNVCRILFGLTFIFSGFVKTVDPWGTAIKMGEYLNVYGVSGVGEGVRMALAIVFCAAELMLGLMMTFGVRTRLVSIFAVAAMIFFTIVTFMSATWMPVEDCGCFGDALKLSPWASFGKNVVLLAMATAVWINARSRDKKILPFALRESILTAVFACVALGIGLGCYLHLPLIDFLPFKKGVDLREAKYGDGESDISLMQFAVFNSSGDATYDLLNTPGRVYMLCAARLDEIAPACAERLGRVVEKAAVEGAEAILITSSPISDGQTATFGADVPVEIFNADATTMKTMLRAGTGMVVIENGVITDKKNCRDIK